MTCEGAPPGPNIDIEYNWTITVQNNVLPQNVVNRSRTLTVEGPDETYATVECEYNITSPPGYLPQKSDKNALLVYREYYQVQFDKFL